MKDEVFTIGKVAQMSGMGIETIRFYEREGLIPKPPRRPSGYRQYSPAIIDRVLFIKKAKDLGFTLAEIRELLGLSVGPDTSCSDVKKKADEKIKEIDAKISELKRIRKALNQLAEQCRGKGPVSECPILENLGTERRKT